jgi:hypothetical protein
MSYQVVDAPEGVWIDADFPLSEGALDCLAAWRDQPATALSEAEGPCVGIFRYTSLPGNSKILDITAAELARILSHPARFAFAWVQHPLAEGWNPELCSGHDFAAAALACAALAECPKDVHGFVDIEGCALRTSSVRFATDWQRLLLDSGTPAGAYYGFDPGMTPEQFWQLPGNAYWAAHGQPDVPNRGPAVRQRYPSVKIPGVGLVDVNDVKRDQKGGIFRAAMGVALEA